MLHVINRHDGKGAMLDRCIQIVEKASAILLIENGVYCGVKTQLMTLDRELFDDVGLYVLTPDLEARGIAVESCYDFIQFIDYDGFVQLVAENNPVRSWF